MHHFDPQADIDYDRGKHAIDALLKSIHLCELSVFLPRIARPLAPHLPPPLRLFIDFSLHTTYQNPPFLQKPRLCLPAPDIPRRSRSNRRNPTTRSRSLTDKAVDEVLAQLVFVDHWFFLAIRQFDNPFPERGKRKYVDVPVVLVH